MELGGKRVLVTGASRGIGEAIARAAAAKGARVALVARDRAKLDAVAAEIDGTVHPADLADRQVVSGLIEAVEADGGPIDVLVNNAGLGVPGSFLDQKPADVEAAYQVNLLTPVQLTHQVLPGMLARGEGHIVNVSSLAGVAAYPGMVVYASTKAGLTQFTEILALDLKGLPVGTTVVQLGPIPTDMLGQVEEYRPTQDSFNRGYKLRLIVDVPKEKVADDVIAAIEKGKIHVRHPKRALVFPLLAEAPRRMSNLLLRGVKHQSD